MHGVGQAGANGAENEGVQLWDEIACCFAWKVFFSGKEANPEGTEPKGMNL